MCGGNHCGTTEPGAIARKSIWIGALTKLVKVASQRSSSGSWTWLASSEPSDQGMSYTALCSVHFLFSKNDCVFARLHSVPWVARNTVGCTDDLTLFSIKGYGISCRFLQSHMQITEPRPFS